MNLIKAGSGTLTLNTANAFTGGTSITGGSRGSWKRRRPGTGPVSIDNAALNIAGFNLTNPVSFTGTNTLTGSAFAKLKTISGDGTVNLNISSGLFDLNGNMTGFSGALAITSNINMRFVNGSGSAAATFDLGTGTGNINVRNNLPAIAMGALKGGSGTILYGQSNDNTPTTFTIGGNDQDCTFSGGIRNGTFGPRPSRRSPRPAPEPSPSPAPATTPARPWSTKARSVSPALSARPPSPSPMARL